MPAGDWDLTPFFPSIDHAAYATFRAALGSDSAALATTIAALPPVQAAQPVIDAWVTPLTQLEQLAARLGHIDTYLHCMASADADDAAAAREIAALDEVNTNVEKALVAVRAGLATADDDAMARLLAAPALAGAEHFLTRVRQDTRHMMTPELEGLAADLMPTALSAWGRLYSQLSGSLRFDLIRPGRTTETHPVAMTRTFLEDADPVTRRAALDGANRAWASIATSTAAALNAIVGTRLQLYKRRGVPHYLEPACFGAGIERSTLDAMMTAVRDRQEVARRYLRAKRKRLGLPVLGFHDLMAALPADVAGESRIDWTTACDQIDRAFAAAFPAMATFARQALAKRWVDYTARSGKRPGGFCASSKLLGESRIFLTFHGAMGDAQTMSHELGHAYHNWVMRDLRPWARDYPMTLAETASTFAEDIVLGARLRDPALPAGQRLALLDARLDGAAAFLLNIPMRFDFECALYDARAQGELAPPELCAMMEAAQRRNYGDVLDGGTLDPWFWASKLHFFITEISFYNFPYTFGYLFSRALTTRFEAEGPAFLPRYEALLRDTGAAPAEEVARRHLGVELGEPTFWAQAIDSLEPELKLYEAI